MQPVKNRDRDPYTFANINLLGACNARCFFCLGRDISAELAPHHQLATPFAQWANFEPFLQRCQAEGVTKLYLTGQTADGLQYRYLDELIDHVQSRGFTLGLRTNGLLARAKMDSIRRMKGGIGYSVHSLRRETNALMGTPSSVAWDQVIPDSGPNVRVSIVVNRYNVFEFVDLVGYLARFSNVRYIQARRVSTDTRYEFHKPDIDAYETLLSSVRASQPQVAEFCRSPGYLICGKPVFFWKTIETSVNSLNYFTDGTCSDEYFIVEGYLKHAHQPVAQPG